MGRSLSLDKIPSETRNSFLALCADQPGLTLNDHVDWFSEQGYKVSRSAIHRYITAHIQPDSEAESCGELPEQWSIRLQCLTIAASYAQPQNKEELLAAAEELLAWVKASK